MASWSNGIPICENYCIFKRKSLLKSEKNYASHKKIMTSRYPNDSRTEDIYFYIVITEHLSVISYKLDSLVFYLQVMYVNNL